jgi:hypothetical protein
MTEVTTTWLKSSYCADSACVEVAKVGDRIAVRDAKRLDQPNLSFTREQWHDFLGGIRDADFDFRSNPV